MSSALQTQVLPKTRAGGGSLRERFLGMFQSSSPERAPAAPAPPLSEAQRLEALLAQAAAGDQQPAKRAVMSLTSRSAVVWDIKVLEEILTGVPATMETVDLQTTV